MGANSWINCCTFHSEGFLFLCTLSSKDAQWNWATSAVIKSICVCLAATSQTCAHSFVFFSFGLATAPSWLVGRLACVSLSTALLLRCISLNKLVWPGLNASQKSFGWASVTPQNADIYSEMRLAHTWSLKWDFRTRGQKVHVKISFRTFFSLTWSCSMQQKF